MNDRLGFSRAIAQALQGPQSDSGHARPALNVILDEAGAVSRSSIGRYGEEIARALVATAPEGIDVVGYAPGNKPEDRELLSTRLPMLNEIRFARIPARELREAWLHSMTTMQVPGLVHATSLLAPMRSDGKAAGDQWVVTVHGDTALSDRSSRKAKWFARALRRAHRLADAVVVPTHAVAARISEHYDFGTRLRVIGAGVGAGLRVPLDADERATRLALPRDYVLVMTSPSSRQSARLIVDTIAAAAMPDLPVVLVGPVGWDDTTIGELSVAAGLPPSRIKTLGDLEDPDLAVVYDRAMLMFAADAHDGFGLSLLEASSFGTPVVHLALPSLVEIAGEASVAVPVVGDGTQAERMALAISDLASDTASRTTLSMLAKDRSAAFTYSGAAKQIWQLHADL